MQCQRMRGEYGLKELPVLVSEDTRSVSLGSREELVKRAI